MLLAFLAGTLSLGLREIGTSAEFATGTAGVPAGLTDSFEGLDDDTFGVGANLDTGLLDSVYNVPVVPADTFEFTFATPANDTAAVTEAQNVYNTSMTDMTTAATDYSNGDYTDGAVYDNLGQVDFATIPDQIQFVGAIEELLPLFPGM
jgi:hypothetical protein